MVTEERHLVVFPAIYCCHSYCLCIYRLEIKRSWEHCFFDNPGVIRCYCSCLPGGISFEPWAVRKKLNPRKEELGQLLDSLKNANGI